MSVWGNWRDDTPSVVKQCLKHDFKYWKVPRFVKDPKQVELVQQVVEKYFDLLKAEHIQMAASSIFPASSLNEFTSYSRKAKFHDKNVS